MAYDASISNEVSLSKILDEMILDDTDTEVIKTFLQQHESKIDEIFKQSSFVYHLYDIVSNPHSFEDKYFVERLYHLNDTDVFYAITSYMSYVYAYDLDRTTLNELKTNQTVKDVVKHFTYAIGNRRQFQGIREDEGIALSDIDLVKYLESISGDARDVSNFICNSYFFKSAMMPSTFLRLSLATQYSLVGGIVQKMNDGIGFSFSYGVSFSKHDDDALRNACCDILISLLKQFLTMNDIESFNWFLNIIGGVNGTQNKETTIRIGLVLFDRLPKTIQESIYNNAGFEDVVFDMNMVETTFDSTDLFLYAYIASDKMRKSMLENTDMIEFFNPIFDWKQLEYLKKSI